MTLNTSSSRLDRTLPRIDLARMRQEWLSEVEIIGLNEASATIVDRLALHDRPGALERLLEH